MTRDSATLGLASGRVSPGDAFQNWLREQHEQAVQRRICERRVNHTALVEQSNQDRARRQKRSGFGRSTVLSGIELPCDCEVSFFREISAACDAFFLRRGVSTPPGNGLPA